MNQKFKITKWEKKDKKVEVSCITCRRIYLNHKSFQLNLSKYNRFWCGYGTRKGIPELGYLIEKLLLH